MSVVDVLVRAGRASTVAKRRSTRLRHLVPFRLVYLLNRSRSAMSRFRSAYAPVLEASSATNLFHCCVHKTGSQWIKSLLTDLMTHRYCGLAHYHYQSRMFRGGDPRPLHERTFEDAFPARTLVSPLYVTYENFAAIPKAGSYRAFFVARDPRDVLVSWYFSAKRSHVLHGELAEIRPTLERLPHAEGLVYCIDHLADFGLFRALRSWADAADTDPDVMLVRYEDLIGADGAEVVRRLFEHLDIRMPDDRRRELLEAYSFERVTGRRKGEESRRSHVRKAQHGDWVNHFDETVRKRFDERAGDVVPALGYD